eukprot:3936112-Rhodomonas_salina.6
MAYVSTGHGLGQYQLFLEIGDSHHTRAQYRTAHSKRVGRYSAAAPYARSVPDVAQHRRRPIL